MGKRELIVASTMARRTELIGAGTELIEAVKEG
jgi:hypothetical protein